MLNIMLFFPYKENHSATQCLLNRRLAEEIRNWKQDGGSPAKLQAPTQAMNLLLNVTHKLWKVIYILIQCPWNRGNMTIGVQK